MFSVNIYLFHLTTGFPFFSQEIPCYISRFCQIKKTIFQVFVWAILTLKGRCQWHSKIADAQKLDKIVSIYRFYLCFLLNVLFLSRFWHFWGQIPGYFWTWTDNIQIFPSFPGFQVPLGTLLQYKSKC